LEQLALEDNRMKSIGLGILLLLCGQFGMFRNPDNAPVPVFIGAMIIGLLLFLVGARQARLIEHEDSPPGIKPYTVRVKPAFLVVSIAFICWTTARSLQPHVSFWEQLLTWFVAIGMFCASFGHYPGAQPKTNRRGLERDSVICIALLLAGLLIHTIALGQTPALFDQDEALFANEGVKLGLNQFLVSPFAPGLQSHPFLFQGLIGLSISIFGQTVFAARLVSAIFGAAGIAAIYLLGKELFGIQTGLFAALFALAWPFHVLFAR
jgi:hypothetical protein